MEFHTTIVQAGTTATGIRVPDDIIAALGPSRRPQVRVTVNGFSYRTTVALMNGAFMCSISADVRESAGVARGDQVDVDIALDTELREVTVPADFRAALDADPEASTFFDSLSSSQRSAYVLWIESATTEEARRRRVPAAVRMLKAGRKQR